VVAQDLPAVAYSRHGMLGAIEVTSAGGPGVRGHAQKKLFDNRPPPKTTGTGGDRAAVDSQKSSIRYDRRLWRKTLAASSITGAGNPGDWKHTAGGSMNACWQEWYSSGNGDAAAPAWAQKPVTSLHSSREPVAVGAAEPGNRTGDRLQDQLRASSGAARRCDPRDGPR